MEHPQELTRIDLACKNKIVTSAIVVSALVSATLDSGYDVAFDATLLLGLSSYRYNTDVALARS